MGKMKTLIGILVTGLALPIFAQENAVITGRITNASGGPEVAVAIRIAELNVGTTSVSDGSYRLVIPGSRLLAARSVTVTASRQGLETSSRIVRLAAGMQVTQNFTLGSSVVSLSATAEPEDAIVLGRVTNAKGEPEADVWVRIVALGAGTKSAQDGKYRLVVPGSRLRSPRLNVTLMASRKDLEESARRITVSARSNMTQNFVLQNKKKK